MPAKPTAKYLGTAVFFCCFSFINLALACDRAAGVVPFSNHDGKILLLIADHKINRGRGWAAFGGCVDNDESISAAAIRELHEETRCALNQAITLSNKNPKVSFDKFTSFAIEVPFIDAELINNNPLPAHCHGPVIHERGPWAWVELSALLSQIKAQPSGNSPFSDDFLPEAKRRWFWGKSSRVIKALHELKAFQ